MVTGAVSRSTTYISLLNVDATRWDELSQKEQAEKIEKAMKGLSGSDREEMRDELLALIADLTESVKESRKDLRKSRHRDKTKTEKRDELVGELDELLVGLKDLKNDVNAAVTNLKRREQTHDRDASSGEDVAILDLELGKPDEDVEKHTYVYRLGGEMAAFADDDPDLSDRDYLLEQGVINQDGVVIKDVRKDGVLNQTDIDEALKERNDVMTKQKVTVRLKPGERVSLSTYDAESGEIVLKVEDERGNFAYLRFENAKNAVFTFNRGFTLDQARGWPEGFLKQVHQNSKKSLHEKLNPATASQEEKLAVIPGFTRIQHELNGLYGYTHAESDYPELVDPAHKEELTWLAKEVIDLLYGLLDGGDLSQEKVFAVWEQINGKLSGLYGASRPIILQLVIVAMAKFSPQNFARLFGPVVGRLEQALADSLGWTVNDDGELTTGAKVAIMLLETKAGPGNYGGGEIWKKYVVDKPNEADVLGKWKHKISTKNALRSYGDIVNHMDGRLPFDIEEMVGRVEGAYATAEDAGESGEESGENSSAGDSAKGNSRKKKTTPANDHDATRFASAREEFESKIPLSHSDAEHYDIDGWGGAVDESEWILFFDRLKGYLFEADGSLKKHPFSALFQLFTDDEAGGIFGGDELEDNDYRGLISSFVVFVHRNFSDEFKRELFTRMAEDAVHFLDSDPGEKGVHHEWAKSILYSYYPAEEEQA